MYSDFSDLSGEAAYIVSFARRSGNFALAVEIDNKRPPISI